MPARNDFGVTTWALGMTFWCALGTFWYFWGNNMIARGDKGALVATFQDTRSAFRARRARSGRNNVRSE